uniref:Secreted protein n=1 Tax=Haemonchus contortus TaxID=6289 RepID=A0A7I4XV24_HAECO|nr:unnamed protein product [Haemonchus contortus]
MALYFSFPLLLMALLLISTVIPSVSSKKTSIDKKKTSIDKKKPRIRYIGNFRGLHVRPKRWSPRFPGVGK